MRAVDLRPFALAVVVGAAISCGATALPPEGQLLVHVDTDAPLPSTEASAEPPLFDRFRIEIFPPGEQAPCAGCVRELAASRELVASRRASFGYVPARSEGGHRVRVRLYRAAWLKNGEPPPETTLETVAVLPPVRADAVTHATIVLRLADVGAARGTLDAPVEASAGAPEGLAVSELARRTPCRAPPGPGEACVPGGAFWMGDPALATLGSDDVQGALPRLVAISPFYVDLHEVTVEELRRAPFVGAGGPDGDPPERAGCTFTASPGPNERRPVTCVSFARAKEHCERLGRSLLTEAQYEYVAGALAGRSYVWGTEDPKCTDAVYGRDPNGTERTKACVRAVGSGVAETGTAARDRLMLEGGEVLDIAGNVSEWVLDAWQRDGASCWGTGLVRDPLCTAAGNEQSVRGGSWALFDVLLRAQVRGRLPRAARPGGGVGFRCARAAR